MSAKPSSALSDLIKTVFRAKNPLGIGCPNVSSEELGAILIQMGFSQDDIDSLDQPHMRGWLVSFLRCSGYRIREDKLKSMSPRQVSIYS